MAGAFAGVNPDLPGAGGQRIASMKAMKRRRDCWGLLDYLFGLILLILLGTLVPKEASDFFPFPDSARAATFFVQR